MQIDHAKALLVDDRPLMHRPIADELSAGGPERIVTWAGGREARSDRQSRISPAPRPVTELRGFLVKDIR